LLSWRRSAKLSSYAWLLLLLQLRTQRSLLLIRLLLRHWRHALEAWHWLLLTWRASREAWRRHALLRWRAQLACDGNEQHQQQQPREATRTVHVCI
jgi:hypothetical protein